jgi:hypothetical protein
MAPTCNPSFWEAEEDQEFEANLSYIERPCLKQKEREKEKKKKYTAKNLYIWSISFKFYFLK